MKNLYLCWYPNQFHALVLTVISVHMNYILKDTKEQCVSIYTSNNPNTILLQYLLVTTEASKIAANFKKTFSRNVRIHFVGVW
jgi:hypothetical protein